MFSQCAESSLLERVLKTPQKNSEKFQKNSKRKFLHFTEMLLLTHESK